MLFSFYKWGICSSEALSNVPSVTELTKDVWFESKPVLFQSHSIVPYCLSGKPITPLPMSKF